MKKLKFQILLYGTLTLFAWMIVGLGAARQNHANVSSLKPVILNEENNHFLGMDDVKEMVQDIQERPLEECKQGEVKIEEIEKTMDRNPYVKKAEAFTDLEGNVVVELELRKPMARIMYEDGSGFYLDHEFNKVDLSNTYSANTPLLRGIHHEPLEPRDTIKSEQLLEMREFLEFVDRSELLRSQISEIVVRTNGDLVIYPEMGDVLVEFGKPTDVQQKFANMELFYRRVLNHTGWKKYKSISLKYKDQVVARRN